MLSQLSPVWFAASVLAVWRVTHLFWAEDGPGNIFAHLRRIAGKSFVARLLDCFYCLSLWVSAGPAYVLVDTWPSRLVVWFALSGGAILLERSTAGKPDLPPPAASWHVEQTPE